MSLRQVSWASRRRPRVRGVAWLLCTLALFLCLGCMAVADGDALSKGCSQGTKECEGECVSEDNPETGCGGESCLACVLPNAVAGCNRESGSCVISACVGTSDDCDQNPDNGCEVNLDIDSDNCGVCGRSCGDPANGEAACGGAQCYVRLCDRGYADCDGVFGTGCETDMEAMGEDCGPCGLVCPGTCEPETCSEDG